MFQVSRFTGISGRALTTSRSTRQTAANAIAALSTTASSNQTDRLLVVGSGVAASATALVAAQVYQIPVTLLFAGGPSGNDCNSYWAQGGIIYRNFENKDPNYPPDSAALLAQDIVTAGAGLCDVHAVHKVAREGPSRVEQLLLDQKGPFASVPFDRTKTGDLSLCLEASHAAPRILHHADATGRVITQHLNDACQRHPLIHMQGHSIVTDLIVENESSEQVCTGVQVLSKKDDTTVTLTKEYATRGVVLCAGGLAGIYQHSTNPLGFNALGSSVALAERNSVHTQDLEFVQFHPTSLNIPDQARFLLTEALRGEGAVLRDADGRAFARDFHDKGELAPRDVVARAVFETSTEGTVYLDITHRQADWLHERFPTIHAHLQKPSIDLDLAKDWLPVIPAAHYTCGGITTNLQGQTSMHNLYAAGEAARTGLHGGNRLASTSLLEGLVFGASVAEHVGQDTDAQDVQEQARIWVEQEKESLSGRTDTLTVDGVKTQKVAEELLQAVRKTMWDHVGVVRTPTGLDAAMEKLQDLKQNAADLFEQSPTPESAGVRDAAFAGHAVAQAASLNRVSAGAHCIVLDEEDDDSDSEEELAMAASAMQ